MSIKFKLYAHRASLSQFEREIDSEHPRLRFSVSKRGSKRIQIEENEVNCPLCKEEVGDFVDLVYHMGISHSNKILKLVRLKKTRDKQMIEFWVEDDPFDLDFPNFDNFNHYPEQYPPLKLTKDLHYDLLLSKIQRVFC